MALGRLLDYFQGQYVSVTSKEVVMNIATDGEINESIEGCWEGFLLDADDEYIYLGKNSDEINQAIKRSDSLFIEIVEDGEYLLAELIPGLPEKDSPEWN